MLAYLELGNAGADGVGHLDEVDILGDPLDHFEAFENVDDIVDASPLDAQFLDAVVQIDLSGRAFGAKLIQKFKAYLAQTFFHSTPAYWLLISSGFTRWRLRPRILGYGFERVFLNLENI
jgi:hypothetical protein